MSLGWSLARRSLGTLLVVSSLFSNAYALELSLGVIGDIDVESNQNAYLGYPEVTSRTQVLISRRQYLINWSSTLRGPKWVSWRLNKKSLGAVDRTNAFRLDHDLSEYLADTNVLPVAPEEYKGSCIDRGHQVASGDRTDSVSDNQATFLMSNISPQTAYLNRKIWVSFERFLRNAVLEQNKEIFILSGVSSKAIGWMGVNQDIQVQDSNFKIAVFKPAGANVPLSKMRLLAVNMPNTTSQGTSPLADNDQACYDSQHMMRLNDTNRAAYWKTYVSSLARIRAVSGLNLSYLSNIPQMSDEEIDDLVGEQIAHSFEQANFVNVLRTAMDSLGQ